MHLFWSLVAIAALIYLGFALALYMFQGRYVYLPSRPLVGTPKEVELSYDDVHFQADDGVALHGWFVPALLWGELTRNTKKP